MAVIRNLRNFDLVGVSDRAAADVARRISDPYEVARSRQFPFRYLAVHRNAPSPRWAQSLESALGHSLANVPALPGRTLVLVDRSGSMFDLPSAGSELTRNYREHDRVIVVTDEQVQSTHCRDPLRAVPRHIPVYTWNLAGYAYGHTAAGPHRHTFGGLSDAAFRLIPLLESGQDSNWPWE